MAHIERRVRHSKTTYRARYRDPAGREHGKVFDRKVRGLWTDPALGRVLLADWHAEWWATTTNLRPTTRARDEMMFRRYVLPTFGPLRLAVIGHRDVRTWVADLAARDLAPSTVTKAYQLLSKVLGAAVDAGAIGRNPCHRVPLPKVEREEMRFLTPAEIHRLAEAIRPPYRALVLVGAYGGLRIGELAGLRHRRVDLTGGTVEVAEIVTEVRGVQHVGPPKTRASRRRVGLPRSVLDALRPHLARSADPDGFVFTAPHGGPVRIAGFRSRFWRPATRAARLDGLRIHDLRHTAVALWIAAGSNPKEVAARAGHTSVSFTLDRYGHLYYPESDAGLRERLDELFAGAVPGEGDEAPVAHVRPQRGPTATVGGDIREANDGN